MKKNIFTKICALLSVFAIGGASGCSTLESLLGGFLSGDSTKVESPATSEKPATSESVSMPEESETSEETGTSEDPGTSETPETSEDPGTSETPETPATPDYTLTVTAPTGEVVPYADTVKEYLDAGAGVKVGDYYQKMDTQARPVEIKWNFKGKGQSGFLVEYATKADFSDAITVDVAGGSKRSLEVYNLYKGVTYYVRVTAKNSKGDALVTANGTFETTDLGPRFMYVDGVCNMRDLGGYTTADGKTLVQGIAYRSGHLKPSGGYTNEVSEDGLAYLSDVLGIKAEIDFRTPREAGFEGGSFIPGASLTYITLNGYNHTFQYDDEYKVFFTMLADESNYPMMMHCTGGADRTGSVVYLLQTMLGVSETECLQNYELTSFSIYGLRDTQKVGTEYKTYWDDFMTKLDSYAGNTRQEKVETWMKTVVGITQAQIDKIKGIFYGEIAVDGAFTPTKENAAAKAAQKQYSDALAAWAVQKKED